MKTAPDGNTVNILATGDITAKYAVGYDGDTAGADEAILGFALANTDSGEMIPVRGSGFGIGVAGEAITAGDALTTDADGKLVDLGTASNLVGWSVTDVAAEDDDVLVKIN